MFPDATTRFSDRVSHYVRFRPGYPRELVDLFELSEGAQIADIGSGTGSLSRVFLDAGYGVTGVEPNREMREAGAMLLGQYPAFRSVDARAESTTLNDESCDLIVAGQAFHWFDVEPTRREWKRILKPGGTAGLIWNDRLQDSLFMRDVEALITVFGAQRDADGAIRERGRNRISSFFAPNPVRIAEFSHSQQFDFEGLRGRLLSASYLPLESEAEELTQALRRVFDLHQKDGGVSFDYRTMVYLGKL